MSRMAGRAERSFRNSAAFGPDCELIQLLLFGELISRETADRGGSCLRIVIQLVPYQGLEQGCHLT